MEHVTCEVRGRNKKEQQQQTTGSSSPLPSRLHKGSHKGHQAPVWAADMWVRITGGRDFNFTKICKGKEEKRDEEKKKEITCREHEYQGRHA